MAGIGFELRKILARETLGSTMSAYFYAGMISSGPFILSILGILLIGVLATALGDPSVQIAQFQVSVTYLIASSLILSGTLQLAFTRFISDRLFARDDDEILPSYNAACLCVTLVSGSLGAWLMTTAFDDQSPVYRVLMLMGFVVLNNIWLAVIFLTSMKQYKAVLWVFFLGYALTLGGAVWLYPHGTEGLLAGFVAGQIVLLLGANALIWRNHPSSRYLSGRFFSPRNLYGSLIFVGLFFNLGVWIDKFIFWYSNTGQTVIGPLRASVIYDMPVFIAYLSIIPGMAMFLLRIEADFVEHYHAFYDAIRNGGTLGEIRAQRLRMVRSARTGLYEIFKIQALVCLLIIAFGEPLLNVLGISSLYLPLLQIDVVAAALQVLFLGVLNIFFYLDRRTTVLSLTALFLVLNTVLTRMSLTLGPFAFGYGFACALLVVVILAVWWLDRCLNRLEFHTYMMQRHA